MILSSELRRDGRRVHSKLDLHTATAAVCDGTQRRQVGGGGLVGARELVLVWQCRDGERDAPGESARERETPRALICTRWLLQGSPTKPAW